MFQSLLAVTRDSINLHKSEASSMCTVSPSAEPSLSRVSFTLLDSVYGEDQAIEQRDAGCERCILLSHLMWVKMECRPPPRVHCPSSYEASASPDEPEAVTTRIQEYSSSLHPKYGITNDFFVTTLAPAPTTIALLLSDETYPILPITSQVTWRTTWEYLQPKHSVTDITNLVAGRHCMQRLG